MSSLLKAFPNPDLHPSQFIWYLIFSVPKWNTIQISPLKKGKWKYIFLITIDKVFTSTHVYMSCSPTMSHIVRCSFLIQTWLTGWSKRHTKDQNCCINMAGKVTTPCLCCTILILESTVERRQTYKLLLYYVCRP